MRDIRAKRKQLLFITGRAARFVWVRDGGNTPVDGHPRIHNPRWSMRTVGAGGPGSSPNPAAKAPLTTQQWARLVRTVPRKMMISEQKPVIATDTQGAD